METARDVKCLGGLEREDAAKDPKRERERDKSWRERKWGGGDGVSGRESAREGEREREREREREGERQGGGRVGGRPSEFGEAAKPPSFFGLPEPFAVRFEKRNLVPVPGPRRAAAVAVIRHRKPTPPPRTQAPAAVDGIRARRACVEARGSGARAASSRGVEPRRSGAAPASVHQRQVGRGAARESQLGRFPHNEEHRSACGGGVHEDGHACCRGGWDGAAVRQSARGRARSVGWRGGAGHRRAARSGTICRFRHPGHRLPPRGALSLAGAEPYIGSGVVTCP